MIYNLFYSVLFLFLSSSYVNIPSQNNPEKSKVVSVVKSSILTNTEMVYNNLVTNEFELPKFDVFSEALIGFYLLKEKGLIQKDILTVIDFSLSSNSKRLWVIDLTSNSILFQTLVAHGRNSGQEFAENFSNKAESFKSSLGFYATAEVYAGAARSTVHELWRR